MFWLCDGLTRFGGGLLSYFTLNTKNGYEWAFYFSVINAIGMFVIFIIVAFGIMGNVLLLIPTLFVGIGAGGFWVLSAQILINDAGPKEYGKIWGLLVMFNFVGIFMFNLPIDMVGVGTMVTLMWFIMGVAAAIATLNAWNNDSKTGSD